MKLCTKSVPTISEIVGTVPTIFEIVGTAISCTDICTKIKVSPKTKKNHEKNVGVVYGVWPT